MFSIILGIDSTRLYYFIFSSSSYLFLVSCDPE